MSVEYPMGVSFKTAMGAVPSGPPPRGERGVRESYAHVVGDDGVETQGFVEGVLQVAHGFEVVVGRFCGRVRAERAVDFAAQGGHDFRVAGQRVEEPGERYCGRVAAGEEDGDELVAQHGAVARVRGQRVQEGVALVRFGFGFEL